jgi:hypothetical protein
MSETSEKNSATKSIEDALIDHDVDALVATISENERPLLGLAGLLDWRFQGAISSCLRSGAITGKVGECVYFPVSKNGRLYKILLLGVGSHPTVTAEALKPLQKNLSSLKLNSVGVSRKDFGNPPEELFTKYLKGISLRVTS